MEIPKEKFEQLRENRLSIIEHLKKLAIKADTLNRMHEIETAETRHINEAFASLARKNAAAAEET